jgi:glycerol-3-phosphate acyltransferase PlsY
MIEALPLVVKVQLSFLIGSIPFAVLAMRGTGIDILRAGSCNPGFNNVLRYSKGRALLTLLGDLGKGALVVLLFHRASDPMTLGWLYGFAAVLGHCYSPFLQFSGGKGIAASAGVMSVLYPAIALPGLVLFTALRVTGSKRRWIEAGTIASLTTWFVFAAAVAMLATKPEALFAAGMAAFVTWRHKRNFSILFSAWRAQRDPALSNSEER